ncbi:Gfo/Idh/MocA family oxidoreductase [Leifsonia sp. fls2-241-R2A-40a]|uniref:Gfo/Idh/MocA family protein n=1 Tax=Leifsonia sp. fls2-241-R2A-40a TaxID=3040290 RepID=UPI002551C39B|nr:Gfo/Idh/MocA family oxidoreductase [Leifsonia sp. fls2-241-R2A-40a]
MQSKRTNPGELRVAVVGFGWMGRVHTLAYRRVSEHFPGLPLRPRLAAVADEVPGRAEEAAALFGFERAATDWRALVDALDIDAVSITAPNFLHREIGEAFARAGKHIWIEKPVGVDAADARAVEAAALESGVTARVGFNYRNAPAVRRAKRLIAEGAIGTPTHASFRLLGDYAADPAGAFTWRYELERAGHGVVGDLAAHGVDLIRYLLGEVVDVTSAGAIFIGERRRPTGATTGHVRAEEGDLVTVANEDWSASLLTLDSGAKVTLEASRVAVGHQNDYGFRIHGTHGALEWDFRRMGELLQAGGEHAQDLPMATVFTGPGDGASAAFQPGSALSLSYDDLKVIEAEGFLQAVAGVPGADGAGLADAVAAAEVLDAIAASSESGARVTVAQRIAIAEAAR